MTPVPEPQSYIDAQVSNRDTVLVTPGSPLPSFIPQGAQVYYTRKGTVITTDPNKARMIDSGTDEDVSKALFGVAMSQDGSEQYAAVARDSNGVPVAEIALPRNQMMQGILAAEMNRPKDGLLSVEPKEKLIRDRLGKDMFSFLGDPNAGMVGLRVPQNAVPGGVGIAPPSLPQYQLGGDIGFSAGGGVGIKAPVNDAFSTAGTGTGMAGLGMMGLGLLNDSAPKQQAFQPLGLVSPRQPMGDFRTLYGNYLKQMGILA